MCKVIFITDIIIFIGMVLVTVIVIFTVMFIALVKFKDLFMVMVMVIVIVVVIVGLICHVKVMAILEIRNIMVWLRSWPGMVMIGSLHNS